MAEKILKQNTSSNIPVEEKTELIELNFLNALKNSESQDLIHRNTSRGPHKDDLKVLINKIDAKNLDLKGKERTVASSVEIGRNKFDYRRKRRNSNLTF